VISSDGGLHWRRYGRMVAGAGTAQPNVIELEPGHLIAWLRSRNFWNGYNPAWAYIYRAESWDYGRNWTHPVPTGLPNNNSSMQVTRLQSGALALAYNHQQQRLRSPLNVALSDDQGETWPYCRELEPFNPDGAEFSYPAILQTPDGLIHVAYTYKRTHIKHVVVDEEWIRQGQV
jgi:predicted neuraminidase